MKRFIAIFILAIAMSICLTACKHEHSFGVWNTVDEPSCLAAGIEERICECGYKEMRRVDPLSHTRVLDEAVEPTCTESGLTAGMHCSECGTIIVAQSIVSQLTHQYSSSTDIDCNICGERRVVDCKHTETVAIIGKAATCTATGLTDGEKCKACGETIIAQTIIPVVAHVYDDKYDNTCNECSFLGSQGLEYSELSNGTYAISGIGSCINPDIVIPSMYNGKAVTTISSWAFYKCNSLKSVKISNGIEIIGSRAFQSCTNLTSVEISSSVSVIGSIAFYDCSSLETLFFEEKSRLTSIEKMAFSGCTSLGIVDIPEGVTIIGDGAFFSCSSLTSINVPASVKTIGETAFFNCDSLRNVFLSYGLISIGEAAFSCSSSITEIVLPDSVETIGDEAFSLCTGLIRLTIPNSVKRIGTNVVDGCTRLKEIRYEGTKSQWELVELSSRWIGYAPYATLIFLG